MRVLTKKIIHQTIVKIKSIPVEIISLLLETETENRVIIFLYNRLLISPNPINTHAAITAITP